MTIVGVRDDLTNFQDVIDQGGNSIDFKSCLKDQKWHPKLTPKTVGSIKLLNFAPGIQSCSHGVERGPGDPQKFYGGDCHQQVLLRHDARELRATGHGPRRHGGETLLPREDLDVYEHNDDPREAPSTEETQDRRAVLLPVSLGVAGKIGDLTSLTHISKSSKM